MKVEGVHGISHAACKGQKLIETDVNGSKVNLELTEVHYLPEATINLVSHTRLRAMGVRILDQDNIPQLILNNTTIAYVDTDQNNLSSYGNLWPSPTLSRRIQPQLTSTHGTVGLGV